MALSLEPEACTRTAGGVSHRTHSCSTIQAGGRHNRDFRSVWGFAHDTNLSSGLRTGNGYIGLRPDNSENKGRKLPACEITKKGTHRVSNGCPFVHLVAAEFPSRGTQPTLDCGLAVVAYEQPWLRSGEYVLV